MGEGGQGLCHPGLCDPGQAQAALSGRCCSWVPVHRSGEEGTGRRRTMMCSASLILGIGLGTCINSCNNNKKNHQFAVKFTNSCSISVCLHQAGPFFTSMEATQSCSCFGQGACGRLAAVPGSGPFTDHYPSPPGMVTTFPTLRMRRLRPDPQTQEPNFNTFLGPRPQPHPPPCW